jgi:glycosyltransferase involved in cell wall biosynthesis
MKISYVVPCYNHELFLKDCLNSIKNDIFVESEIIVIDDGSTDKSVSVIKNWISENPSLNVKLIEQSNKGVCATLNKLFDLAQGDFIRPIGSDDVIILESTKKLVFKLQEQNQYLMAFGDSSTIDETGALIAKSHIEYLGKSIKKYQNHLKESVIGSWAVSGPVFLCKKNMLQVVGQYDEELLIEDWNMYLKLVARDSLAFLPEPVAQYRIHKRNTSITDNLNKRIVNLQSQYFGGSKNLDLFSSKYQILLNSRLNLLKAKISFLKKEYFSTALFLICYIGLGVYSWFVLRLSKSV